MKGLRTEFQAPQAKLDKVDQNLSFTTLEHDLNPLKQNNLFERSVT